MDREYFLTSFAVAAAIAVVTQIVSGLSLAVTQWYLDVDTFLDGRGVKARSISGGISGGVAVGFAIGIAEFAVRALFEVRSLTHGGDSAGGEGAAAAVNPDWSRPTGD